MSIQKTENVFTLSISLTLIAAVAAGVLACADYITRKPRRAADLRETTEALKMLQPDLNNNPDQEKIHLVKQNDGKWKFSSSERARQTPVNCVTFYPATDSGKLLSVIGKAISPRGYGGNMTVMVAMKPNGTIQNVIVTQNNETPGLGTVVTNRVREKTISDLFSSKKSDESKLPPNKILDQFDGLRYAPNNAEVQKESENSADKSKIKKDHGKMKQVTGATVKEPVGPGDDNKWKVKKDGGTMEYVTGATVSSRAVIFGVKKIASVYNDTKKEVLAEFKKKLEGN